MAKKQTRRSVSLSQSVYEQLKRHAKGYRVPMSKLVEDLLKDYFKRQAYDRDTLFSE